MFVTVPTKGGFVDVDQGVIDSVKDIQRHLRGRKSLRVVEAADGATVTLTVNNRGAGERDAATVGVPIGNQRMYVPIGTVEVSVTLSAGDYSKDLLCIADNWSGCAKNIAKDVEAWVAANREQLAKLK